MFESSVVRAVLLAGIWATIGCAQTEPSRELLPRARTNPPVAGAVVTPAPLSAEADPFAEERPEDELSEPSDAPLSFEDQMVGQGIDPKAPVIAKVEPLAPAPVVIPQPPVGPVPPIAPPPSFGPAPAVWGVRLVSTVSSAQPPRAILGLPDGTEKVVQPGTFLPEARVFVLAIGQDQVQIAHVIPEGDRARVETEMLSSLYPARVVLNP